METGQRLQIVVEEITNGNKKKFADGAGINKNTLQNYINGRSPKADALEKICDAYNISLNWLVAGKGEKYIKDEKKDQAAGRELEYIGLIEEWVIESADNDPRSEVWFEMQFEKKFPEFKVWLGKKRPEKQEVLDREVHEGVS